MAEVCKNCNHTVTQKFCPNCGQAAHTHKIDWTYLGHEIQHGLFHVDRGILYTTKHLLFHPGYTIKEFINGKRVRHFKPLAYLVIISTIYLLINSAVGEGSFLGGFLESISRYKSENKSSTLQSIRAVISWFENHAVYLTILTIPALALASKWAFRKSRYHYVEHLVLHCYLSGLISVLYTIVTPFYFVAKSSSSRDLLGLLQALFVVFVTLWTFAEFFKPLPFWKVLLRSLLYVFWLLVFFIILATVLGIVFRTPGR